MISDQVPKETDMIATHDSRRTSSMVVDSSSSPSWFDFDHDGPPRQTKETSI